MVEGPCLLRAGAVPSTSPWPIFPHQQRHRSTARGLHNPTGSKTGSNLAWSDTHTACQLGAASDARSSGNPFSCIAPHRDPGEERPPPQCWGSTRRAASCAPAQKCGKRANSGTQWRAHHLLFSKIPFPRTYNRTGSFWLTTVAFSCRKSALTPISINQIRTRNLI